MPKTFGRALTDRDCNAEKDEEPHGRREMRPLEGRQWQMMSVPCGACKIRANERTEGTRSWRPLLVCVRTPRSPGADCQNEQR